MKKIAVAATAVGLSLVLAACGSGEPTKTVTVTASEQAETPPKTSSDSSPSESVPVEEAQEEAEEANLKDSFNIGDMKYVVTKVEKGVPSLSDEYETVTAKGQFVVAHITATNVSTAPSMVDIYAQLVDSNGKIFNSSDDAAILLDQGELEYVELNPDEETSGIIAFDIAADSSPESLLLTDEFFEAEVISLSIK